MLPMDLHQAYTHQEKIHQENDKPSAYLESLPTGPYLSPAFLSMISRKGPSSRVKAGASSAATFNFGVNPSFR